jgi:hypothetical protein
MGAIRMSKIIRTEPNPVLAKAVEYHGFVYVQGCTAQDLAKDGHPRPRGDEQDLVRVAPAGRRPGPGLRPGAHGGRAASCRNHGHSV